MPDPKIAKNCGFYPDEFPQFLSGFWMRSPDLAISIRIQDEAYVKSPFFVN